MGPTAIQARFYVGSIMFLEITFVQWHKQFDIILTILCAFVFACLYFKYRMVLAQSVERPPHNREVVGSIPGRVIPKDVKRWELLLPCLAFNIWKG